jgi:hypothetical protein
MIQQGITDGFTQLRRGAKLPAAALALGQRGPVCAGDLATFLEKIEVVGHG